MNIDKKTVKYISDLARIEMSDADMEYFAPQLTSIFDYVEKINKLDLQGVEPLYNVIGTKNVMDDDVPVVYDNIDEILSVFPKREDRFIKIRKVL